MAGNKAGGLKAAQTNIKRHGEDFYKKIGSMGGKKGHTGGFFANPELASRAGRLGGLRSKRGKNPLVTLRELEQTAAKNDKLIQRLLRKLNGIHETQ